MDIGTQINVALGVMAFLAAQALTAAGVVLLHLVRRPDRTRVAEGADASPHEALPWQS